jgi:hypothetical protein
VRSAIEYGHQFLSVLWSLHAGFKGRALGNDQNLMMNFSFNFGGRR